MVIHCLKTGDYMNILPVKSVLRLNQFLPTKVKLVILIFSRLNMHSIEFEAAIQPPKIENTYTLPQVLS